MRPFVLGLFLTVAVLMPKSGKRSGLPVPHRAAGRDRRRGRRGRSTANRSMVGGLVYYPTRGFRFFDGQVMAQTGIFDRVPVYADTTLEPFSVLYVPVSRDRLREYERRRDPRAGGHDRQPGAVLSGAEPLGPGAARKAPPERPGRLDTSSQFAANDRARSERRALPPAPEPSAVGTAGTFEPRAAAPVANGRHRAPHPARPKLAESAQRPSGPNGVWLDFNGARWYADGAATSFAPGSVRAGRTVPRVSGVSRQGRRERDLGAGREGRDRRSLRETLVNG